MDDGVRWQGQFWRLIDLGDEKPGRYGVIRRYQVETRSSVRVTWHLVRKLAQGEGLDSFIAELLADLPGARKANCC
jgi:hypothetical protein